METPPKTGRADLCKSASLEPATCPANAGTRHRSGCRCANMKTAARFLEGQGGLADNPSQWRSLSSPGWKRSCKLLTDGTRTPKLHTDDSLAAGKINCQEASRSSLHEWVFLPCECGAPSREGWVPTGLGSATLHCPPVPPLSPCARCPRSRCGPHSVNRGELKELKVTAPQIQLFCWLHVNLSSYTVSGTAVSPGPQ